MLNRNQQKTVLQLLLRKKSDGHYRAQTTYSHDHKAFKAVGRPNTVVNDNDNVWY